MAKPVMYFVVNSTLKMGKGKIAAQAGHAAIAVYRSNPRNDLFEAWNNGGYAKVVLAADSVTIEALADRYRRSSERVIDAGFTQVEPGSFTVLGFHVMEAGSNADLSALKLL